MNFSLMKHHGYSLTELEDMLPFERDVYVQLLNQYLEELKQKHKQNSQQDLSWT